MDELDFFSDYTSRIPNIAPQHCLITKTANLQPNYKYDLFSLAMWTMLHIYEGMFTDEFKTIKALAADLQERIKVAYKEDVDEDSAIKLATNIVYSVLQNDGIPFEYSAPDPLTGENIALTVKLVEAKEINIVERTASFALTSQGLWLLYSTKEVPSELRISVEQLFLRQQYESGRYEQSLNHIRNIILLIKGFRGELEAFTRALYTDVYSVSFASYKNFENKLTRYSEHEKQQFKAFARQVREDIKQYDDADTNLMSKKDRETQLMLKQIKKSLSRASKEHFALISDITAFPNNFQKAYQERVIIEINKSLHYQRDILTPLLANNGSIDAAHIAVHYLFMTTPNLFNPMWWLQPQSLRKYDLDFEEASNQDEIDLAAEQKEQEKELKRFQKYKTYLTSLLVETRAQERISLAECFSKYESYQNDYDFYVLITWIYSVGVINLVKIAEESEHESVSFALDLDNLLSVIIADNPQIIAARYFFCVASQGTFAAQCGTVYQNLDFYMIDHPEEVELIV